MKDKNWGNYNRWLSRLVSEGGGRLTDEYHHVLGFVLVKFIKGISIGIARDLGKFAEKREQAGLSRVKILESPWA